MAVWTPVRRPLLRDGAAACTAAVALLVAGFVHDNSKHPMRALAVEVAVATVLAVAFAWLSLRRDGRTAMSDADFLADDDVVWGPRAANADARSPRRLLLAALGVATLLTFDFIGHAFGSSGLVLLGGGCSSLWAARRVTRIEEQRGAQLVSRRVAAHPGQQASRAYAFAVPETSRGAARPD